MRVQVTRESDLGFCASPVCAGPPKEDRVRRVTVWLGEAESFTSWLCDGCFDQDTQDISLDLVVPTVSQVCPPSNRVKKTSRKRELEIASAVGGRRQPGSGNQPFAKGDIRKKGEFRVEAKECFGLEFKVHRVNLLDKIRAECSRGESPAVVVTFRDKGTHQELDSWAMVPFEVWKEKMNDAGKHPGPRPAK